MMNVHNLGYSPRAFPFGYASSYSTNYRLNFGLFGFARGALSGVELCLDCSDLFGSGRVEIFEPRAFFGHDGAFQLNETFIQIAIINCDYCFCCIRSPKYVYL